MSRVATTGRMKARDMGTSLLFGTSSTDKLTTPLTAHNATRTYSAWIKIRGSGGGSLGRIFDKRVSESEVELLFYGAGEIKYVRVFSGGSAEWGIPAPVSKEWVHLVVTYDSSSASNDPTFYINGTVVSLTTNANPSGTATTNTDAYVVGNRGNDNARNWDGYIDEFKIYDAVLTADEVMELYTTGSVIGVSPILSYDLDEGSGTIATDSSGNGNNGTITGATYSTDVFIKPRLKIRDMGTCLSFASTGNHVAIPHNNLLNIGTDIALSAWIKLNRGGGNSQTIMSKDSGDTGAGTPQYALDINSGKLRLFGFASGVAKGVLTPTNCPDLRDGRWHFVMGIRSGTQFTTYVDNVQMDTGNSVDALTATDSPLRLGIRADTARLEGKIDEVRIFSQALSSAERTKLYIDGQSATTSPVLKIDFNEGAGTAVADSSGNSLNGTISGAVFSDDVFLRPRRKVSATSEELVYNYIRSLGGLVAYYPLNEESGSAINRAPATEGTLNGDVSGTTVQGVDGLAGKAYEFVQDPITTSTANSVRGQSLVTVGAIVKVTDNAANRTIWLEPTNVGTASTRFGFGILANDTVYIGGRAGDGIGFQSVASPYVLPNDKFYYIAAGVDVPNKVGRIFINGRQVVSGSFSGFNAATFTDSAPGASVRIGKHTNSLEPFVGRMQHVFKVHGRLLTASEHRRIAELAGLI
jgi:hypothetical protein